MMNKLPQTLPALLWFFARKYLRYYIGLLIALVAWALLSSLHPYFMKLVIDGISDIAICKDSKDLLQNIMVPVVGFIVLFQLTDFSWNLQDYFRLKMMPNIRADIINALFSHLQNHAYSFFQRNFSGTIANKVNDMARSIEAILSELAEPFFSQLMLLVVAAISMLTVHPGFTGILLLWAVIFLGLVLFFYKGILQKSTAYSEANSKVIGKLVDSVTNFMTMKLFANNDYECRYLGQHVEAAKAKDVALQWYMLKIKALQGLSVTLLFSAMLWLLIYERMNSKVTVGDFAFILTLTMTVMQGLWYLASHFLDLADEIGICNQALSLLKVPIEIVDKEGARELVVSEGKITFDHVTFKYDKGKDVFIDKSITIAGGEKIGLVGFSGSGKTTFTNLILRLYEVTAGEILIDGQNIASVTQASLHKHISLIPQEPILFHRSLLENIRYGKLDASMEEVIAACEKAHAHEFIELLPDKYETLVGERGLRLSGGQRQRIAIARAILKNAPILILDEATSALDSVTEAKIQESLDFLMQNRTTLVVAHRLSTLSGMDRTLVFNGGQIVESGTHQELLALEGYYAKLWQLQAGGFLPHEDDADDDEYEEE